MGGEWKLMTLREAGISLIDCVHKTPEAVAKGFPYIAIPQMKEGRLEPESARQISEEDLKLWTKKADPQPFDVVLSRRCNPGETAHVPEGMKFALGQNLVLLRANGDSVMPEFLRWLVRGPEWWDQIRTYMNVGAVFTSLKCADVPNFEVTIPPKEAQKAIFETLNALDDKIEINRAINRTLEAMAQAIFKSWFVDFDPVKAKMAARESGADPTRAAMAVISGNNDAELDAFRQEDPKSYQRLHDTAQAFPDALVESELGLIPEGWGVGTLGDIASNVRESVNPELIGGDTPYVGLEHVDRKHIYLTQWGRASEVESNKSRFRLGDILFGKLRPYFHKVCFAHFEGICSTDIIVVRPKRPEWSGHVQCQLFEDAFVEYANLRSTGTRMPRANWKDMAAFGIVLPEKGLAARFTQIIREMNLKAAGNVETSATAANLRNSLLPRLLSGEILIA